MLFFKIGFLEIVVLSAEEVAFFRKIYIFLAIRSMVILSVKILHFMKYLQICQRLA